MSSLEMKFIRTIMKKAVENCKSISDNKEVAKVWVRSFTETDILLYTQRDNRGIKYFHHIKTLEPLESEISFLANPYELEKLLAGRETNRVWTFEDDNEMNFVSDQTGNKLQIQLYKGKFPLEKLPYMPMNDSSDFKDLLEEIVKAASKEVASIEIGGYEVSLKAPIYLKRFNLIEDFQKFIFPMDYIEQLNKNIIWPKSNINNISQCSKGNELYIRIESENKKKPNAMFRQLFVLTQRQTYSPVAKQMEEEIVHTFKVNTEELWKLLNQYPAAIADVYLYDEDGQLVIDPYDKGGEPLEESEDQPIHKMDYEGHLKRTKVERSGLMALISGYASEQAIDIIKYMEDAEEAYAFRIYDKFLYSIVSTKKEPNYAKVQARLDKQLEYEKTLDFLND